MDTSQIRQAFEREFGNLAAKFQLLELHGLAAASDADPRAARPGVYVHWKAGTVIRVGRSLSDARRRALEHIRDDTGRSMAALKDDPDARLLLFTVERDDDCHWIAALELFFERSLKPLIPPKRRG